MTGLISAFVENVATVLVMAPIALSLCDKTKTNPIYFMVGLAVMANLQGTATLVGDPPSMIFASFARYSFNDFFWYLGKPSIFFAVQVGMLAGGIYFWFAFRKTPNIKMTLDKEPIRSFVPSILLIVMIGGLALTSFLSPEGGVSLASGLLVVFLALFGLFWYIFIQKQGFSGGKDLIWRLDWDTTLFLVGIYIVIGALSSTGILVDFADLLSTYISGNILLGFILIILLSTVLSGFIDNIPYIIVMLPVAKELILHLNITAGIGLYPELYMFALLIGSCMGGNLTPFGASANIVTIGILEKKGYSVSFRQWLKIGIPFTLITTTVASLFVWFIWFIWT